LALIAAQKTELEETHHGLKAAQAKLVEAEKYQQAKDIAGGFAHEIRNALFPADGLVTKSIRLHVQMHNLPGVFLDHCHGIRRSIQRAIDLTEQISSYTQLESKYAPEPVRLHDVITETVSANRSRIDDNVVMVSVDVPDDAIVAANRSQAYTVFNNLLLNALDAVEGVTDAMISVLAECNAETVEVRFVDNGIGIQNTDIDRVFDTFFSTKPNSGTGLGLSMTRKIVEAYGGSISVHSDSGGGAEFALIFRRHNDKRVKPRVSHVPE